MKYFYLILGPFFFINTIASGQVAQVSGYITEFGSGLPVPNHQLSVREYSQFTPVISIGITDSTGYYSVGILTPLSYLDSIHIRTDNCDGQELDTMLYTSPFAADFVLCDSCGASFTYSVDTTTFGLVHLYNTSFGNIIDGNWDLGNGSIIPYWHSSYTYPQPGTYDVSLIINGLSCTDTASSFITINPPPLSAIFSYAIDTLNPLQVQFSDLSGGFPTSWDWNFGDGSTSTDQHPDHIYANTGSYTVSLTISDGSSTDTYSEVVLIDPGPSPLIASFSYTIDSVSLLLVHFNDLSAGSPNSWYWDFGDGTDSYDQHPGHAFSDTGTYVVSLTASDGLFSDTYSEIVSIKTNSIDGIDWVSSIEVVPNPSNGIFELRHDMLYGKDVRMNIRNIQGQQVYSTAIEKGSTVQVVDLTRFARGIYILELRGSSSSYQQKIVIK